MFTADGALYAAIIWAMEGAETDAGRDAAEALVLCLFYAHGEDHGSGAPCLRSRRAYLRPCSALKVGQLFLSERKSSNPSQRRNGFVILSSAMVEEGRQP